MASKTGLPWTFRGIQMDLARHMETVDYIRHHADEAARHGFNTLVLYLEGRVRTDSFPYRPEADSYSLEDMEQVVRHATGLGMDVIPVVSTLGHCEQFLACPPLRSMSETRDGRARFGTPSGGGHVICPSQDATYEFFSRYLGELSQVFTGPNLHVGLDEAWDLGYCGLCRERWERDGLASLFMAHLTRMHGLLRRLNRRLWMWDDFFELFPDKVASIPKDVVLCHWCYADQIDPAGIQAHFVNQARRNWLALYERAGLDAVVCPWDRNPKNIEAITDYARRHRVLGGLLTEWEGSPRFHAGQPVIASFTGALWSGRTYEPKAAWSSAMRRVLPGAPRGMQAAIRDWLRLIRQPSLGGLQSFLGGQPVREEALAHTVSHLTREAILGGRDQVRPAARPVLAAVEWNVEAECLLGEMRELAVSALHPRRPAADVPVLRRRLTAWFLVYRALMRRRPAVFGGPSAYAHADDISADKAWKTLPDTLSPVRKALERSPGRRDWLLILRLFLQDYYGAPRLRVTLIFAKGRRQVAVEGGLKPAALAAGRTGGHYDLYVPFTSSGSPKGVELEAWGYGGQGVAFLELQNPTMTLKPAGIRRVEGPVSAPDALLKDDSRVTLLGRADILTEIHMPQLAEQRAVIELDMA
jgi:hypothetical protein